VEKTSDLEDETKAVLAANARRLGKEQTLYFYAMPTFFRGEKEPGTP
jgi:hypothetical protein